MAGYGLGYDPKFLGTGMEIAMPTVRRDMLDEVASTPRLDYQRFSVIQNKRVEKRSPFVAALNFKTEWLVKVKSPPRRYPFWIFDTRIPETEQLGQDYYSEERVDAPTVRDPHNTDPLWERGHMAMRYHASWAANYDEDLPTEKLEQLKEEAQSSSDSTYHWTNACLQHRDLNGSEWLNLERWARTGTTAVDGRVTTFQGPIYYRDHSTNSATGGRRKITVGGMPDVWVPDAFFKIICFKDKRTNTLKVRAFVMSQEEGSALVSDTHVPHSDVIAHNSVYQAAVTDIENLTGLQFDPKLKEVNPMDVSTITRIAAEEDVVTVTGSARGEILKLATMPN